MGESMSEVLELPPLVICQPLVVNGVNVSAPLSNIEWIELFSETRFLPSLMSSNLFLNIVSVVSTIKKKD